MKKIIEWAIGLSIVVAAAIAATYMRTHGM